MITNLHKKEQEVLNEVSKFAGVVTIRFRLEVCESLRENRRHMPRRPPDELVFFKRSASNYEERRATVEDKAKAELSLAHLWMQYAVPGGRPQVMWYTWRPNKRNQMCMFNAGWGELPSSMKAKEKAVVPLVDIVGNTLAHLHVVAESSWGGKVARPDAKVETIFTEAHFEYPLQVTHGSLIEQVLKRQRVTNFDGTQVPVWALCCARPQDIFCGAKTTDNALAFATAHYYVCIREQVLAWLGYTHGQFTESLGGQSEAMVAMCAWHAWSTPYLCDETWDDKTQKWVDCDQWSLLRTIPNGAGRAGDCEDSAADTCFSFHELFYDLGNYTSYAPHIVSVAQRYCCFMVDACVQTASGDDSMHQFCIFVPFWRLLDSLVDEKQRQALANVLTAAQKEKSEDLKVLFAESTDRSYPSWVYIHPVDAIIKASLEHEAKGDQVNVVSVGVTGGIFTREGYYKFVTCGYSPFLYDKLGWTHMQFDGKSIQGPAGASMPDIVNGNVKLTAIDVTKGARPSLSTVYSCRQAPQPLHGPEEVHCAISKVRSSIDTSIVWSRREDAKPDLSHLPDLQVKYIGVCPITDEHSLHAWSITKSQRASVDDPLDFHELLLT